MERALIQDSFRESPISEVTAGGVVASVSRAGTLGQEKPSSLRRNAVAGDAVSDLDKVIQLVRIRVERDHPGMASHALIPTVEHLGVRLFEVPVSRSVSSDICLDVVASRASRVGLVRRLWLIWNRSQTAEFRSRSLASYPLADKSPHVGSRPEERALQRGTAIDAGKPRDFADRVSKTGTS